MHVRSCVVHAIACVHVCVCFVVVIVITVSFNVWVSVYQKQAWPLLSGRWRGSVMLAERCAHQFGAVNGTGSGTLPLHGTVVPSISCRGLGRVAGNDQSRWPTQTKQSF